MNKYLIIIDDAEKKESSLEKFDDMDSFNKRKVELKDKGFRVTKSNKNYRQILNGCDFVIASNRSEKRDAHL